MFKRMSPTQKRPHAKRQRTGVGHCVKSLPLMLKGLNFHFWEMDSAECSAEAKAWLSEGVPADIQLQPTQRHWKKG